MKTRPFSHTWCKIFHQVFSSDFTFPKQQKHNTLALLTEWNSTITSEIPRFSWLQIASQCTSHQVMLPWWALPSLLLWIKSRKFYFIVDYFSASADHKVQLRMCRLFSLKTTAWCFVYTHTVPHHHRLGSSVVQWKVFLQFVLCACSHFVLYEILERLNPF